MLRVAVIGMRGIGTTHATCYAGDSLAELVVCCDMVKERADSTAQRFGAKPYYSVQEMLAKEKLDAVSVSTGGFENGGDHYTPVMECLNAGLHVLCEKPLSNNIEQAREMEKFAERAARINALIGKIRPIERELTAGKTVARGRLDEIQKEVDALAAR